MDCLFLVWADAASIDQGTNRLSIFNIVEEVTAASFPAVLANTTLVAMLERSPSEPDHADIAIRFETSGKKVDIPSRVDFRGNKRLRLILTLQNIQILGPQQVRILVLYKGKPIGPHWAADIKAVAQPQIVPPAKTQSTTSVSTSGTNTKPKRKKR
jgi:acyl-coenzyme A synthetase/AMP-(fatty) acid ligase